MNLSHSGALARAQVLPAEERTSDLTRTSFSRPTRLTETCPVSATRTRPAAQSGNAETPAVTRPLGRDSKPQVEQVSHIELPNLADLIRPEAILPEAIVPGTLVANRYEILQRVAHDGMGIIYKALDRNRQAAGAPRPWVALKFARPAGGELTATAEHLRQEFLKLSQLSHPGIVAVYDFASDRGVEFMVLEWLTGDNLATVLNGLGSKRIALGKALEIIRTVGEALAFTHAVGITHGDIKPSNIFIADDRIIKVLDFGAAGQSPYAAVAREDASWATPVYASCAVLDGEQPQPVDDVYSLGVTAYSLLSGERPFGDRDAITARDHGLVPAPLPDDASDYWPAVERALRFAAVDRFITAEEFLDHIVEQPDEPPRAGIQTAITLQVPTFAYGALALIIVVAIVLWAIPNGDSRSGIGSLLDSAAVALSAGRLIGPGEDNAFDFYQLILDGDPSHPAALEGLDRIAEEYLARARSALAAGNYEGAIANFETARDVQPEHFGIAAMADLVGRYRQDLLVSAQRLSATDLPQAQQYLARAAAMSPENDPAVADVQRELQQQESAAALDDLLRGIDQRILSERLVLPQGDSAIDLLRRAAQLAPGERQVQVAAERIASALLFQSMFAISNGDLDAAQAFIDSAKGLNLKHLAMARAEYELARARTRAMTSTGG
ncbi:MAG: protein kinase [Woeseia sp.]